MGSETVTYHRKMGSSENVHNLDNAERGPVADDTHTHCPTCGQPIGYSYEVLDSVHTLAAQVAREEIAARMGGDVIFQRWHDAEKRANVMEAALNSLIVVSEQTAALAKAALERAG